MSEYKKKPGYQTMLVYDIVSKTEFDHCFVIGLQAGIID